MHDIAQLLALFSSQRPANTRGPREWYRIRNANKQGEAEIFIYDVIGESWFGGITANQFVQDLRAVEADKILLRVNSPGGDIFDGIAIRNALIEHPAEVEGHVDGMAASTASWVALASDSLVIAPSAVMMIHEPMNIAMGDAEFMRKEAERLDMFGDDIADMYVKKAGGTRQEWRDRMRAETWYTDQQAVDAGLADEVAGQEAAENRYDPALLGVFKNTPKHLLPGKPAPAPTPTPAEPETKVDLLPGLLAFQRNRARLMGHG